jgi:hypothetical protein
MDGLVDPTPSAEGATPVVRGSGEPDAGAARTDRAAPEPVVDGPSPMVRALGGMRDHLAHLEQLCGAEIEQAEARLVPILRAAAEGENRLPAAAAVAVAIALQVALPNQLTFHPTWLLPLLEGALLIGLFVANPRKIDRESRVLRAASLILTAVVSVDTVWSAAQLIRGLLDKSIGSSAGPLLSNGASIYLTNIIVFGLWYWEFDRGGPVARLKGTDPFPDFLFPQMTSPNMAPPDWAPTFVDYLYVSFTNATAFSPTDTMPLSRWAKSAMAVQAGVSLAIGALVVARAVNILK